MSRRRRGKTPPKSVWITLLTALVAAAVLFLQPILADYGIDLNQWIEALLGNGSMQTAVYPSEGTAEVHFIDVGQASCILIKGSEKNTLIDGGEAETAPQVIAYLEKQGVTKLDYFFNTHPHADHMGGCRAILEAVPTANFIMTPLPPALVPTTTSYKKLIGYLGDHREEIASATARVGELYELGGGLRLETLGPVKSYDDLNDQSIVLRLDFGKTSMLFTGDMEAKAQQDLLETGTLGRIDLLSAPHHGSNTSIDKKFMQTISPTISVISCGKANDYGHPHRETLELYDRMEITPYRTDRQGTVLAVTDGERITLTTDRNVQ